MWRRPLRHRYYHGQLLRWEKQWNVSQINKQANKTEHRKTPFLPISLHIKISYRLKNPQTMLLLTLKTTWNHGYGFKVVEIHTRFFPLLQQFPVYSFHHHQDISKLIYNIFMLKQLFLENNCQPIDNKCRGWK